MTRIADPAVPRNASAPKEEPKFLTPEAVSRIHHYGGTILGSDRYVAPRMESG